MLSHAENKENLDRNQEKTRQDMIQKIIDKAIKITNKPEKQLIEIRMYTLFYREMLNRVEDDYYNFFYKDNERIYSPEDQANILLDFQKTRRALSAVFTQDLIIRAFDMAQDNFFKRYHISNKQKNILSDEKKQEILPTLQTALESKQKTAWKKENNFDDAFNLGPDILLNRFVSYHCQSPSSKFKKIKISGYKDNTITVFLSILPPFYPTISAFLKKMGFSCVFRSKRTVISFLKRTLLSELCGQSFRFIRTPSLLTLDYLLSLTSL